MYDWPEVQGRTDAFWGRIRGALQARGLSAPEVLSRPEDLSAPWSDRALLLGQTCGLPYVSDRCGEAVIVARPDYGVEGATGGVYASALICRADEEGDFASFRGRTAVINEYGSQSGCNALAGHIARMKLDREGPFLGAIKLSGAHRASAKIVADGAADIAAIDAVAWALFAECEPDSHARLRVLEWTRPMPALPYITGPENRDKAAEIYAALLDALPDLEEPVPVGIPCDFLPADDGDYDPIRKMADRVAGMKLAPDARRL